MVRNNICRFFIIFISTIISVRFVVCKIKYCFIKNIYLIKIKRVIYILITIFRFNMIEVFVIKHENTNEKKKYFLYFSVTIKGTPNEVQSLSQQDKLYKISNISQILLF